MISKNEFLEIFKPLRVNFPDVKNEKLQEDYERLNIYSPELLKRTVDYLVENYRGRTYPVFAEIWTALETVCETHQPELKTRNINEQCQKCHDTSYILEEKYLQYSHHETGQVMRPSRTDTARFCDCEIGRKRKAAFLAYWQSKHDVQKASLETRKAWEETN